MNAPGRFAGWPADAASLVERSIERHGGRAAWHAFRSLRVECRKFSGLALAVTGAGHTYAFPPVFLVDPKAQRTTFPDFPAPGRTTIYERGALTVLDADSGRLDIFEHYRARFTGMFAKLRRWSDLDAAYFLGYSQANYHAYPFALEDLVFIARREYAQTGDRWQELTLEYPAGLDTHCRRQRFHFDGTALLRRVDYRVDIVGAASTSAHFYENCTVVSGVVFPRRRRIVARLFDVPTPVRLIVLDVTLTAIG